MPVIIINAWKAVITTIYGLFSWGQNNYGQVGDGTTVDKTIPTQNVAGGTDWDKIACGYHHSGAIKDDGTLWTWGRGTHGQIGDNSIVSKSSPVQTIAGGTDWAQVSCGPFTTGAIKTDGSLWLWGDGSTGEIGDNATVKRSSPVQTVAGGTDWKQVYCGYYHTIAVKTDGTLWSWGADWYGQLGDGTTVDKSSPVQTISGGTDWSKVACGYSISTAIKTDGTLWTWGADWYGQIGDGASITHRSSPVQTTAGGTDWTEVAAGGPRVAAISNPDEILMELWAWGGNYSGPLGDGTNVNKSSPVQTISGGTDWSQVAAGWWHTAGIKWLWGWDGYGQLGDESTTNKSSPVQTVVGGTDWTDVTCGYASSAAIKTDGTLWLWGINNAGQLGDGTSVNKSSPVQIITGGTDWSQLSMKAFHAGAIKTDGTLWMWGSNGARLGDNTLLNRSSPVQTISGGTDWDQVSCGTSHTGAIKTDGTLWMWGGNTGCLGDGTNINRSSPVQTISGGIDWYQVACGRDHTAAIKNDGTLWTWGQNNAGQLGDNTNVSKSSPVQTTAGGTDWTDVTCGNYHTAAIKVDGSLWLWGWDGYGQLGDNTNVSKSSPVQTVAGGTDWTDVTCGYSHTIVMVEQIGLM
jgi:alpha-tubulin suppressor-like RCC1 family protein